MRIKLNKKVGKLIFKGTSNYDGVLQAYTLQVKNNSFMLDYSQYKIFKLLR